MLTHYATRDEVRDGKTFMVITSELVDDPCQDCGAESVPNQCRGDGKYHYHGRIHIKGGHLGAYCKPCADKHNATWPTRPWENVPAPVKA